MFYQSKFRLISVVRAMCGIQLSDRKRSTDLMFMQGLKEAIDQLAMANSVRWCCHVLRREDDNEKGIRFFG